VYILCAVESGRTTGANAIGAKGLDSLLFQRLVCDEVVEVEGGEVRDGAAIGELRLGSCGSVPRLALRCANMFRAVVCHTPQSRVSFHCRALQM
jgi:hypothetical protein